MNMSGSLKIGILSGFYPGLRFESPINHKAYADTHGYYYNYNFTPERDRRRYFFKIETLLRSIDLFDWIFWIDDDAFFTDFSIPLTKYLDFIGDAELLICSSPSTKKNFTKFSSGQFFLKSSPRAKEFLLTIMGIDMEAVKAFWREDLGDFTQGDQDAMVYLTETDPRFNSNFIKIVDHYQFNNRDFEYENRLNEHFLVHFTGTEKQLSHAEFVKRLQINQWLIPTDMVAQYNLLDK